MTTGETKCEKIELRKRVDTDIRGVFIEEQRSKRKESFAIR
jgi:hypothetical protein